MREGIREWKEKIGFFYIDYVLRLENKYLDGCVFLLDRLEFLKFLFKKVLCCEVGIE